MFCPGLTPKSTAKSGCATLRAAAGMAARRRACVAGTVTGGAQEAAGCAKERRALCRKMAANLSLTTVSEYCYQGGVVKSNISIYD